MNQKLLPGKTPAPLYCSRSRKFTFVHNQKTGGSTIVTMLLEQVDDLEQMALESDWRDVAKTLKEHDCFDGYFKFAFVRNPWDRFVSYYSMMLRKLMEAGAGPGSEWLCQRCGGTFTNNRPAPKESVRPNGTTGATLTCLKCFKRQAVLKSLAPDTRSRLPEKPMWDVMLAMPDLSFPAFVEKLGSLDNHADDVGWTGVGWTGPYAYLRSQVETLSDGGELFLDDLCRFENYEPDVTRIFGQLGLDASSIPRINVSPHKPYREFYGPSERAFIERVNAADIETFGYSF